MPVGLAYLNPKGLRVGFRSQWALGDAKSWLSKCLMEPRLMLYYAIAYTQCEETVQYKNTVRFPFLLFRAL